MKKPSQTNHHLNASDREIWNKIARTAEPLAEKDKNKTSLYAELENILNDKPISLAPVQKLKSSVMPVYFPPVEKRPELATGEIDKKTTRKISKGRIAVDGRIDLHGLTQREAYHKLYDFVENAWYDGKKILLVITGKGNLGRGILRENVPKWLASAPFMPLVSEFGTSQNAHGGNGALYVRVRRNPNSGPPHRQTGSLI